jgi:quinol monooxygenase YgiN
MLIASLACEIHPEKRQEFVSAATGMLERLRHRRGCLGCRLMLDCENPNSVTLFSEWDQQDFLEDYLESGEFQLLEGARFLLRDGPRLAVDEVISRGRFPDPRRR